MTWLVEGIQKFSCSDASDAQDQGDYWCPEGYSYDSVFTHCQLDTFQCDSGPVGSPAAGCNDLVNPGDDYWLLYDGDCVFDDAVSNLYDKGCCAGPTIGTFQIYLSEDVIVY